MYYDVARPSYWLMKTDPKRYQEEWKAYVKSRLYAQQRAADYAFDMRALAAMNMMYAQSGGLSGLGMGVPCVGCTLGGGFGLFG